MENTPRINFVFFGTDEFSVEVLNQLEHSSLNPSLIITAPDRKAGRGMLLTKPPVKKWAELKNIEALQPETLDENIVSILKQEPYDIFIVASYGKIISKTILDIPKKGALNVHPSLLPKYRGPSPVEEQILDDEQEVGVTIMLMDEKMDHGPIIAQTHYDTEHNEQLTTPELSLELARRGGALLQKILPKWLDGSLAPTEQDHTKATFTKKLKKEDGLIDLNDNGYKNYLKYLAYQPWPGVYIFKEQDGKQIRMKIKSAKYTNGTFHVLTVIPENGHEIAF